MKASKARRLPTPKANSIHRPHGQLQEAQGARAGMLPGEPRKMLFFNFAQFTRTKEFFQHSSKNREMSVD